MCLISRRADLPNVENEIHNYWSSLNSVTGKDVLFVFSSQKDTSEKTIKEIKGRRTQFEIPKAIRFHSSMSEKEELKFKLISDFTKENYKKYNIWNGEWYLGQELQTNQIASFFGLSEVDIPCLHLTFLIPGFEYVIKLNESKDIYSLTKKVIETLDAGHYGNILIQTKNLIEKKRDLKKKINKYFKSKHFNSYDKLHSLIEKDEIDGDIKEVISHILKLKPNNSPPIKKLEENIRFLKKNSKFKNYYSSYKKDFKNLYDVLIGNITEVNIDDFYINLSQTRKELELTDKSINNVLASSKNDLIKLLNKELNQYEKPNMIGENIIQKVITTLELKPNVFGLGINLNQMIELLFFKK
jgi:L-rhamnose mutarotase